MSGVELPRLTQVFHTPPPEKVRDDDFEGAQGVLGPFVGILDVGVVHSQVEVVTFWVPNKKGKVLKKKRL